MIFLYILLAIIAILFLVAAILPKTFTVSSEISIDRPCKEVFNYVKHRINQEKYSVWVIADPNIKIDYKGTDGTVGFISSWTSDNKNVGVGAQEIKTIQEGEQDHVELRFEKPFKVTNRAYTTTIPIDDNRTRVTPFSMEKMSFQ
jgi:hypothetical protein